MSPLHDACRAGDTERVKQLLDGDGGAHVDGKDEEGWTALGRASYEGQTEIVKLLLDQGVLLNEKDKYGRTALMWASLRGPGGMTALMLASIKGHTEVVRLLLDKGALLDENNEDGGTAPLRTTLKGVLDYNLRL